MTAPDATGIRIEGLDELVRSLKRAEVDLDDLKDANRRAGEIVAREAEAIAPRKTGRLAGTIRAARQVRRARISAGAARAPYAGPIHWGWPARHIAAQPFVANAAQATESQWTRAYVEDVEAALKKVRGT